MVARCWSEKFYFALPVLLILMILFAADVRIPSGAFLTSL